MIAVLGGLWLLGGSSSRATHGPSKRPRASPAPGPPLVGGPKAGGYAGEEHAETPVDMHFYPPGVASVPGVRVKSVDTLWGTTQAIISLRVIVEQWLECSAAAGLPYTLRVGDVSRFGGGKLPPHKSHHIGRDVDLSMRGERPIPLEALPCLLEVILADPNVRAVFMGWGVQEQLADYLEMVDWPQRERLLSELQWPLPAGTGDTRVRHSDGHTNHVHVRFWQ